jgi:hypothetical protein
VNEALPRDLVAIDSLLGRTAREFSYPATPRISPGVMARVREPQRATQGFAWGTAWRFAGAAAVVIAIVAGAALAVPQSREALADFFGLSHVRIEVGPNLGPPAPVLDPDNFARPATLSEAQAAVDFDLRFPTTDGERIVPDATLLAYEASTVIFLYEDEGYDLYQTRGGLFGKGAPEPSSYEALEIDGVPAYWFFEGNHIAWLEDEYGRVVIESRRTVERATLLWEDAGITYRLETSLSQEEAIEVARSLH